MCNYLLNNLFLENAKNLGRSNEAKRSKTGNSLRDKKIYVTPTNEDLGQTSNWSKLEAAYLPVARLTILDRLVLFALSVISATPFDFEICITTFNSPLYNIVISFL